MIDNKILKALRGLYKLNGIFIEDYEVSNVYSDDLYGCNYTFFCGLAGDMLRIFDKEGDYPTQTMVRDVHTFLRNKNILSRANYHSGDLTNLRRANVT